MLTDRLHQLDNQHLDPLYDDDVCMYESVPVSSKEKTPEGFCLFCGRGEGCECDRPDEDSDLFDPYFDEQRFWPLQDAVVLSVAHAS